MRIVKKTTSLRMPVWFWEWTPTAGGLQKSAAYIISQIRSRMMLMAVSPQHTFM